MIYIKYNVKTRINKEEKVDIQVYEIKVKLHMLKTVPLNQIQSEVTSWLDKGFATDKKLLELHESKCTKGYCFDLPYRCEADRIYKKDKIYTLTIRTIHLKWVHYFTEVALKQSTQNLKPVTISLQLLPRKWITSLYTLTPVIIKNPGKGYWKTFMPEEEYEKRICVNLIKKWNYFTGQKMNEDFSLYTLFQFLNKGPIKVPYKNVTLLGDKIELAITEEENAQNLAYLALGTGLGEGGSRGFGFVNYKWF